LLDFDAELPPEHERRIGVVAKRLEQLVLPLGEARKGCCRSKRSGLAIRAI